MEYVLDSLLPTVVKYQAKAKPFMEYMFSPTLLESVSPIAWWKSIGDRVDDKDHQVVSKVPGASASSAGVEQVFSTFGFIPSKIRNRLGTKKSGKLVFVFKLLNNLSQNKLLFLKSKVEKYFPDFIVGWIS